MAFLTGLAALAKQGYDIFRTRKRERREIDEALDRQPLVREQLELGNVGAAVEHLTAIIDQMAEAKRRDEAEYEARDHRHRAKVLGLEEELREVRAHAKEWERKYDALDERCRKITAVLRRHDWDIDD